MFQMTLDYSTNIYNKQSRFFMILLKKSFKFALNREDSIIIYNLSLMLLLIEVNLFPKK